MEPKKKPWIDIHGLRLPDFLKPLLRAGTVHVYDAMQLLGHTVNNIADVMQRNWHRLEEFATNVAKNEDERMAREKQRIASEDLRREQEEVREVGEKTRKRNEVWRQQNEEERMANENVRKANEAEREANEEKRIEQYEKELDLYPKTVKATQDADNAAKSADAVLDKIAQKEYGYVKLTANEMKALIESGQVNNGLKYLVVANNRVVGVYYGKMPQAGCELAVINETLVGRSTI